MTDKRHHNDDDNLRMIASISWLSSGLVGLLALASFSLSFEALRGLAVETGVVSVKLGWIFPLIVDGAIVVFSLSALRASLRKERTAWLRGLVIFATCASIFFNIAHVEIQWLAMILAATPPVLLFLSFEALMHSIQAEMQRVIETDLQSNDSTNDLKEKKLKRAAKHAKKTNARKSDRLEKVKKLHEQGLSPAQIVEQLDNVSLRTVQRDLAAICQKGDSPEGDR